MAKRPHIVIFNPDQWRGDVLGQVGGPALADLKERMLQFFMETGDVVPYDTDRRG